MRFSSVKNESCTFKVINCDRKSYGRMVCFVFSQRGRQDQKVLAVRRSKHSAVELPRVCVSSQFAVGYVSLIRIPGSSFYSYSPRTRIYLSSASVIFDDRNRKRGKLSYTFHVNSFFQLKGKRRDQQNWKQNI